MSGVRVRRHVRRRHIQRRPQEPATFVVAIRRGTFSIKDDKGRVIGTIVGDFDHDAKVANIDAIEIDEQHRRKGLGSRLVERFEKEARRRGMILVTLAARGEDAVQFWEAMGYYSSDDDVLDDFLAVTTGKSLTAMERTL